MKRVIAFLFASCFAALTFFSAAQDFDYPVDSISNGSVVVSDFRPFDPWDLREPVFDRYYHLDTLSIATPLNATSINDREITGWLDDAVFNRNLIRQARQRYMIQYPQFVKYNEAWLPMAPRSVHFELDPMTARLTTKVDSVLPVGDIPLTTDVAPDIVKRHWIRNFDTALQFSQAYVSPNWYQGGSNNLTMLFQVGYAVKLNQAFHPRLLCEMSVNYKLNVHGTPEDSLRNYNISEDLFQFNGKVGVKAWRNWFYSISGTFKTQFFKNYEVNKKDLRAAFLSPAELNLGLGMTWDHTNPRKTFTVNASISPISWNMKSCIHPDMNVADFGIQPGHKTVNEFGSSFEIKMKWNLNYNITWQSRLFAFTDYTYAQADWENTFNFAINRFLSTQLYVHVRYDSTTPRPEAGSKWHKWQIKEILSLGFSYKFATI